MHPKSVKDRAIVHYLHFLPSLRRVSRVYGVGKSTLGRWIKTNSAKVDKPASRVPLHRKIAEMVGKITQNDPFCKGHQVVSQLRQQGIKASEATVSRARHVAGYSRKRVRACYLPTLYTEVVFLFKHHHLQTSIRSSTSRLWSICDTCVPEHI